MKQRLCLRLLTTLYVLFSPLQVVFFNNLSAATPDFHPQHHCSVACGHHLLAAQLRKGIAILPNHPLPFRIKTIVIDAGHGGHDPGCSGSGSQEKHIALAVAQKFAAHIEAKFPAVRVILTRDKDVFVPLYERAAIANRANADLFISIHCNAMPKPGPTSGSETYVMGLHTAAHNLKVAKRENDAILLEDNYERNYDYDPNSPEGHILLSMFQNAFLEQSILFAERVEHHFQATAQRKSRGVKQAGFVVLKETAMPSVLVETGFLSSKTDEAFLSDENGQNAIAAALFNAFAEYKTKVEGGASAPAPIQPAVASTAAASSSAPAPQPVNTSPSKPSAAPATAQPRAVLASATTSTPSTPGSAKPAAPPTATPAAAPRPTGTPTVPRPIQSNQPAVVQAEPTIAVRTPQTPAVPAQVPQSYNTTPGTQAKGGGDTRWAADLGKNEAPAVVFCVQLAASPRPTDVQSGKWQSSGHLIQVVQEEDLYKYQVRNFKTLEAAMEARIQLQNNGFPDAFIVAYHQGKRINMADAKKLIGAD